MANNQAFAFKMRVIHRYLGFFLAGIMAVYSISGIILVFRDTDFLKHEKQVTKQVKPNAQPDELGKMLQIRDLKIDKEEGNTLFFKNGTYDKVTGTANYTVKELAFVAEKMTHLHKAKSGDKLFFLNIFFGVSLFFFVISSFWMFMPSTDIFKKGMYFAIGGIILTLILLFV
ncbi:MAG: PepSY domain-containing protein [Saprospiraceae bacterium]|nr:PepSY domain-containing protein [Saprospiraceae bacterium]